MVAENEIRELKRSGVFGLLNATPLGPVLTQSLWTRITQSGGYRCGQPNAYSLPGIIGVLEDALAGRAAAAHAIAPAKGDLIIPAVADPSRREQAMSSLKVFCETYRARVFTLGWSRAMLKALDTFECVIRDGGRYSFAMPRGSGKSKVCEFAMLYATLKGVRQYVLLIGADEGSASKRFEGVRTQLETNRLMVADFPEVCTPIRALMGRRRSLMYQGRRINLEVTDGRIILPDLEGPACDNLIEIASLLGQIRGREYQRRDGLSVRPDLVVLDDPQTKTSAKSQEQCDSRLDIIETDVAGLAGPTTELAILAAVTVVRPKDLAEHLLTDPEWNGQRTAMLESMPTNLDLWEQYGALGRPTEFYLANQAEMDAGAVASWPERMLPRTASAIQTAMNIYLKNQDLFWAEYQNAPLDKSAGGREYPLGEITESPAAFRDWLQLPDGRSFGKALDPFQQADFAVLDKAFAGMVAGEKVDLRRIYLERATGHSKTYDTAVMAAWALAYSPRTLRGVVAGVDKPGARRFINQIRQIVCENPKLQELLVCRINRVFNPLTNSEIAIISSDATAAADLGQPDLIICDQVAAWKDAKRFAALQSAIGNPSCLLIVTSQAGRLAGESWQWRSREYAAASPDWYFSTVPGELASWLDREFLAEQKRTLTAPKYKRVYRNLWTSAAEAPLLPDDVIKPQIRTDCLWTAGKIPNGPANLYVGIDIGRRRDLAVIAIVEDLRGEVWIRAIRVIRDTPYTEQGKIYAEVVKHPRVMQARIDAGVGGSQIAEDLEIEFSTARGLVLNETMQGELAEVIRDLFSTGKILVPDDIDLLTDLGAVEEVGETQSGKPKLLTPRNSAGHADRFWALALALEGVPLRYRDVGPIMTVDSRWA